MVWLNFKRIFRTGVVNFWRNGVVSLAAVLVMIITLLIVAIVLFSSALLNHTLDSLKEKVDVNINMLTTVSEEQVLTLKAELEKLPEVERVEYISSQQALNNYIERHKDEAETLAALDELTENPLGASLNIKATDPRHYSSIQAFLDQYQTRIGTGNFIEKINFAEKQLAIERLSQIIDAGNRFGLAITLIFIILSVLITLNTIRLAIYISKEEIRLMNLVGAEHGYIGGPFVVTGAFYGVVSAMVVLILLYPITYWFAPTIEPIFFDMNIFDYYVRNFGQMFLIIFSAGILIGAISSFLAINRYLKN